MQPPAGRPRATEFDPIRLRRASRPDALAAIDACHDRPASTMRPDSAVLSPETARRLFERAAAMADAPATTPETAIDYRKTLNLPDTPFRCGATCRRRSQGG